MLRDLQSNMSTLKNKQFQSDVPLDSFCPIIAPMFCHHLKETQKVKVKPTRIFAFVGVFVLGLKSNPGSLFDTLNFDKQV